MMRSGIHVFLTVLPCDVWQLSHTRSPGGGQRAEKDHAFFELGLLPPDLPPSLGVGRGEEGEGAEVGGQVVFVKNNKYR